MARKGSKRIKAHREAVPRLEHHSLEDAVGIVKQKADAKFDETVDLAVRLGVNPRHADQMVRGAVVLPNGTGQNVRVAVFAKGDKAKEAEEAGADIVGDDDLVAKVQAGFLDFDRVIASPDMMGKVGKLGRVLGPRGLMPNPKVGTVTPDVGEAVRKAKAGQVQYRTDKAGIIHCSIGTVKFEVAALRENLEALIGDLQKSKPSAAKGVYVRKITVSSTMGPGVPVDKASLEV